ncbi:Chloroperoxidase [Chytriomyces cf. hyalinus JEL632]|nr:Chloroperoxidase [Chytriomyces cf. hyalinus JEL632]
MTEVTVQISARPQPILEHIAASPTDSRGPCPALNALANSGALPRDGRRITAQMLKSAVETVFNVDASAKINALFAATKKDGSSSGNEVDQEDVINLEDLSFHDNESAEHDVSFTRRDTFFGSSSYPEPEYIHALMNASADGESLTVADLVKHRLTRFNHSLEHNPDLTFWGGQVLSCCIETYLIVNVFGRNGKISIQDARAFLGEERIPVDYMRPDSLVSAFNGILDTRIVPIMAKVSFPHSIHQVSLLKTPYIATVGMDILVQQPNQQ